MKGNTGLITHYQRKINAIADRDNTVDAIEITLEEDTRVKTETMRKDIENRAKILKEDNKKTPNISVEQFKEELDKAIEEEFGRLEKT